MTKFTVTLIGTWSTDFVTLKTVKQEVVKRKAQFLSPYHFLQKMTWFTVMITKNHHNFLGSVDMHD